jgi:hypothetical protein
MTADEFQSLLASVLRNTGRDPTWIGYWMQRFVESERISPSDLAKQLGTTSEKFALLCLCRTPRPDHFQEDLLVACQRSDALVAEVVRVIRQEQAVIRWQEGTASKSAGWLMAASDHMPPDEGADTEPKDG